MLVGRPKAGLSVCVINKNSLQKMLNFVISLCYISIMLTTHRMAYLSCQCIASLDMKLALSLEVARNER